MSESKQKYVMPGYTREKVGHALKSLRNVLALAREFVPAGIQIYPPGHGDVPDLKQQITGDAHYAFRNTLVAYLDLAGMLELLNDGDEESLINRLLACSDEEFDYWFRQIEESACERGML